MKKEYVFIPEKMCISALIIPEKVYNGDAGLFSAYFYQSFYA